MSKDAFYKNIEPSKTALSERYYLGEVYDGAYLTLREAETMKNLLLGKTIHDTAFSMKISPRTAEFYINNIKRKFRCRTKKELIGKVMVSDILKEFIQ